MAKLLYSEVRAFIADSTANNHLLDDVEFTDIRIDLAMNMAIDSYNNLPPMSSVTLEEVTSDNITIGYYSDEMRSKSIFLYGTLWHLFSGQSALAARNQMSYSDGGLTIPIEERYQFYVQLAAQFEQNFKASAKDLKIALNLEDGWSSVRTDYSTFPIW